MQIESICLKSVVLGGNRIWKCCKWRRKCKRDSCLKTRISRWIPNKVLHNLIVSSQLLTVIYFELFVKWLKPRKPYWLLLDGYFIHSKDLEALSLARKSDIMFQITAYLHNISTWITRYKFSPIVDTRSVLMLFGLVE